MKHAYKTKPMLTNEMHAWDLSSKNQNNQFSIQVPFMKWACFIKGACKMKWESVHDLSGKNENNQFVAERS